MAQADVPSSGVVCPTWLNPDIQSQNLFYFLNSTGVDASGFISETKRLCKESASLSTAKYTGSWNDASPTHNDIKILKALQAWVRKEGRQTDKSYDDWAGRGQESWVGKMVKQIAGNSLKVSRALDFGCGSGDDLTSIRHVFNLRTTDCLCLDVVPVHNDNVMPFLLNASSDSAYKQSLETALAGNEQTVDVAISIVAFHHIPSPKMRSDALNFLYRILAPGGIFVMLEWDNPGRPDRWIHYDLIHVIGPILWPEYGDFKMRPDQLPQNTEYNAVADYISLVEAHGLVYDVTRSGDPETQAEGPGKANRDFRVVWNKTG